MPGGPGQWGCCGPGHTCRSTQISYLLSQIAAFATTAAAEKKEDHCLRRITQIVPSAYMCGFFTGVQPCGQTCGRLCG